MDWLKIFNPNAWFSLYPTCDKWDKQLNKLLNEHKLYRDLDEPLYCVIGGTRVWTKGWPYAYGATYEIKDRVLPYYRTRMRLKALVDKYDEEQALTAFVKYLMEQTDIADYPIDRNIYSK